MVIAIQHRRLPLLQLKMVCVRPRCGQPFSFGWYLRRNNPHGITSDMGLAMDGYVACISFRWSHWLPRQDWLESRNGMNLGVDHQHPLTARRVGLRLSLCSRVGSGLYITSGPGHRTQVTGRTFALSEAHAQVSTSVRLPSLTASHLLFLVLSFHDKKLSTALSAPPSL